jgi:hypothetical protein
MVVYSIAMVFTLFCQLVVKHNRKVVLGIVMVFLFTISAFRYNVGTDYQHYVDIYNWIVSGLGAYVEPGFYYFNVVIQRLGGNNTWVFFFSSLLLFLSLWVGLTKCVDSKYWFFAAFLFITTGTFFSSMNLLRQYMAISIVVMATPWLIEKKNIRYIIATFIAILFHTSAIIIFLFIILVLLDDFKIMPILMWVTYFTSLLFVIIDFRSIIFIFGQFIPSRWSGYLDSGFFLQRNTFAMLKLIVPNITLIFLLINKKSLLTQNPSNKIYIVGSFLYTIFSNLFFGVTVLTRLSEYFYLFFIVSIILVIKLCQDRLSRLIITTFYIIYYIVLTVVTIFMMNGYGVIPYMSIFG